MLLGKCLTINGQGAVCVSEMVDGSNSFAPPSSPSRSRYMTIRMLVESTPGTCSNNSCTESAVLLLIFVLWFYHP